MHFAYERAPRRFGGRAGEGPLEIVWDTNSLLGYFFHGSAIWDGEQVDTADVDYAAELKLCSGSSNSGFAGTCGFACSTGRARMRTRSFRSGACPSDAMRRSARGRSQTRRLG